MANPLSKPTPVRPGVVTISTYLLLLFAFTQLLSLIMVISVSGSIKQGFQDAYEGTEDVETIGTVAVAFAVASVAVVLVLALVLVVLAMFNNRGRNGTRIATWVVGGILVCCVGGSVVSGASGFSQGASGGGGDAPSGAEVERSMSDALPSWYGPTSTAVNILGLAALLAALILLALPKAHPFFRKATAEWEPPAPGANYPGNPQAPGQPGYPQASGEPGYPSSGEPSYPPPPAANRPEDTPPTDRPGSTPPPTN
ncbi:MULTISPECIES: hypothetical protein [Micromonospora]|uniref:hypothetical protein n=1 Tax=Micromonospora TaxID=1873 RepID=UPI001EE98DD8|nr:MULTISPECIES: hypothetical protein [Micromonospora]MCG5450849.1 hypothetical protein [Micromonospora hortensis]MCX5119536.1 hypothetical protein [Micromonospora sp. NBC_00362]